MSLLQRIYPRADADYWRLQRVRHVRPALRSLAPQLDALGRTSSKGEPAHLLVIPDIGPAFGKWRVGGGSLMFEAWQSAVELMGPERVTLFEVTADESEHDWHARLVETLATVPVTHVLAQIEEDPERRQPWSWDVVAAALGRHWDGAFIGFMYDSAHQWLRIRAHRMARLLPSLLVVDLCVPIAGELRRGRYEVGPTTMPMSQASVAAIDDYVAGCTKDFDVTFIGALYDYRIGLLERLEAAGVNVVVNPHRTTPAATYLESRTDMPTYLDYMAGLARSELTVNFSLASGGPHEQYKIRVQEASIVGSLIVTDDRERTREFFAPNEYAFFASPEDLARVAVERLSDRDTLHRDQAAARERAKSLARNDFWGRIDVGLARRGLPPLTGVRPPRL